MVERPIAAITVSFVAGESTIDFGESDILVSGGELSNFQEAVQAIQQHLHLMVMVLRLSMSPLAQLVRQLLSNWGMISIILLLLWFRRLGNVINGDGTVIAVGELGANGFQGR